VEENLRKAIEDFRYLLDRGYRRESALKFVGDRYLLNKQTRLLLYRCVYGAKEAEKHRRKMVSQAEIQNKDLAVDGYNALITVESMLQDRLLILCDDGFIRDLSAIHGKHKVTPTTIQALRLIAEKIREAKVRRTKIFFDSQVSRSGELASSLRKIFEEENVAGDVEAVKQADVQVLGWAKIVASSDTVIIEKAEKVFDLVGEIIKHKAPNKILSLDKVANLHF